MVEEVQNQIDESVLNNLREEIYTLKGKILSYLKKNKNSEKPITSEDIQREFGINKSTASQYICALEKAKLIKRETIGRIKSIKITKLGESFV